MWHNGKSVRVYPRPRAFSGIVAVLMTNRAVFLLSLKVVDAYATEPVFIAVSLGLALLGWNFRRRLKIQARAERA